MKIKIEIKSSRIIGLLFKLGIKTKIGDIIYLPIDKLWYNSNLKVNVKCDICNKEKSLNFSLYNKNYNKYKIYCCSNKCSSFKNKLTCLEQYGDENYNNIDKMKNTKLEKYGNENFNNIIKNKETCLKKYDDENYNNREKFKNTCVEKYGVVNVFLHKDIIEKTKKTNLEKYNTEDSRSSEIVINKRKTTNLKKYGNEYYSNPDKTKETKLKKYGNPVYNNREKQKETCLEKYGVISNSLTEDSKNKLRGTNYKKYGVYYPMQVEEFAIKQQKNSLKIHYYNEDFYYQSSYEKDFLNYMNNKNLLNFIKRGKYIKYNFGDELKAYYPDFYLEELNLIIEIKSDYYYEKFLDKNLAKIDTCKKLGYEIIFIINKNYSEFEKKFLYIIK